MTSSLQVLVPKPVGGLTSALDRGPLYIALPRPLEVPYIAICTINSFIVHLAPGGSGIFEG